MDNHCPGCRPDEFSEVDPLGLSGRLDPLPEKLVTESIPSGDDRLRKIFLEACSTWDPIEVIPEEPSIRDRERIDWEG